MICNKKVESGGKRVYFCTGVGKVDRIKVCAGLSSTCTETEADIVVVPSTALVEVYFLRYEGTEEVLMEVTLCSQ